MMFTRKVKSLFSLIRKGELLNQLRKKYYVNINSNSKNTIFISGTGRSGSTWLSQILNYKNDYRYIFEPFYPEKVDFCSFFKKKQYLRPNQNYPQHYEAAKKILTGEIRNTFIDRYNNKLFCSKRIAKDVETNLLLGWVHQNFKEVKNILIIRHPCATANSWLKLKWETNMDWYLNQQELMEDYLEEYQRNIEGAKDPFEKVIYLWCIENLVPLEQMNKKILDAKVVYYEDLCNEFESSIEQIFQFVGLKFNEDVLKTKELISYTTRAFAAALNKKSLTDSWKNDLDKDKITKAREIVELFGLENLYDF